ncbi:MAG: NAD(P)/FAD-dependent oxidoreductase [Candidatus Margulisbacteria bacterium]|nr:NAD(P)/FAD-dependent oxidoreductase [Candidatus Margulisiibacteriota bacterium]
MEKFDVIIIGTGPAGLNCAYHLINSGLKVLVLEKNKTIGPKVCAGGFTQKTLDYLRFPSEQLDFSYDTIYFNTPHIHTKIKFQRNFAYTIDRKNLGQWMLSRLEQNNNITLRTETLVTAINKEYVTTNRNYCIKYKWLVGSDGSNSSVRKFLGLKNSITGMAMQYLVCSEKYRNFEIYYDSKLFKAWYAWIFPHKDYVSIGCGSDPKVLSTIECKRNFHIWLKNNKINTTGARFEVFPINYDYKGHVFGNIFLTGDAAGLASGFTGEGIYQALISGQEAARQIISGVADISLEMAGTIKYNRRHRQILNILIKTGHWRGLLLDIIALSLKIKSIARRVLDIVA